MTTLNWITPTVDEPPPVDEWLFVAVESDGPTPCYIVCTVDDDGYLWTDPDSGRVLHTTADDILRYVPLADLLAAIGGKR